MHLLYYYIMSECRGIFGNYFCQFSPFFLLRTLPTHSILLCFLYILGGGGRGGVAVELVDIFKDYFFYLGRGGGWVLLPFAAFSPPLNTPLSECVWNCSSKLQRAQIIICYFNSGPVTLALRQSLITEVEKIIGMCMITCFWCTDSMSSV